MYSCIVAGLESGLNLKPPDDCLFRSLGTMSEFLGLINLMFSHHYDCNYYVWFFYLSSYSNFFFKERLKNLDIWKSLCEKNSNLLIECK